MTDAAHPSAPWSFGQIVSYTPIKGRGVSYQVNVPQDTASVGSGPIYFQIKAPTDLRWIALGQGARMKHGNLFVVYAASENNVTLSPRRATGPYEPKYNPDIEAYLLDGSEISDGIMTANVRCDNCMLLHDGKNIMSSNSEWIWAATGGDAIHSHDVSATIHQHYWHGIFTLDLMKATGGDSENPFLESESHSYTIVDYTSKSKQQQIDDTSLHRRRIAHGTLTAIAFVILMPNFGLTLYIFPSRWTVPWVHAPLQSFAAILALGGLGLGISVSRGVQDVASYHPVLGYISILGVALVQPALGILQHLRFRKTGQGSWYGLVHRYLARFFIVVGVVNGGIGFHYACTKTPDVPMVSKYAYGFISGTQGVIFILVVWHRRRSSNKGSKARESETTIVKDLGDSESGSITVSEFSDKPGEKAFEISPSAQH